MKNLYEQIKSTVRHHATSLTLPSEITAENISRALHLVHSRHPEYFWLTENFDFNTEERLLQLQYTLPSTIAENTSQRIYEVVQNDFHLQRVRFANPLAKALEVYRWLHHHCRYNATAKGLKDTPSIYDVFITRCANSEGYALAAQYLFQCLDIPVYRISGWLKKEGSDSPHSWNVITLNEENYHFDASCSYETNWNCRNEPINEAIASSWNEIENIYYHFCCLSTKALQLTHVIDQDTVPNCPQSIPADVLQEEIRKLLSIDSFLRLRDTNTAEEGKEEMECEADLSHIEGCRLSIREEGQFHPQYALKTGRKSVKDDDENCDMDLPEPLEISHCILDSDRIAPSIHPCTPPSGISYEAHCQRSDNNHSKQPHQRIRRILHHLFRQEEAESQEVYSSVFAPQEVRPETHLMVELFFHLSEEEEKVRQLASEVQENALRRNQIALDLKVKKGERITADCQFYAQGKLLHSEQQTIVWQGKISRSEFTYFISEKESPKEILCHITISLNGIPMGNMKFLTKVKEQPQSLHVAVAAQHPNKVFISYANKDYPNVKYIAYAYAAQGIDYFFDKSNLKTGDIYEEEIYHYIDQADLFVLCWSANAAKSINVAKEKNRALSHAYPQVSREEATLEIRPVSIQPHAELPDDMKSIYHFATL